MKSFDEKWDILNKYVADQVEASYVATSDLAKQYDRHELALDFFKESMRNDLAVMSLTDEQIEILVSSMANRTNFWKTSDHHLGY